MDGDGMQVGPAIGVQYRAVHCGVPVSEARYARFEFFGVGEAVVES
jgi:hypothetical protein